MEALKWSPEYQVSLIIDDTNELQGRSLSGIPVTSFDELESKLRELKINTLFLAMPRPTESVRNKILNLITNYPVSVKSVESLTGSAFRENCGARPEDLKIEDLLGRAPVELGSDLKQQNIFEKNVLVTGAGGSIGSELSRQIVKFRPKKLILLDISEFSIYNLMGELSVINFEFEIEIFR